MGFSLADGAGTHAQIEATLLAEGVSIKTSYCPEGTSVQVFKQVQGSACKNDRETVAW